MLICLATGITFSNISYHTRSLLKIMDTFTPLVFAVFFTIAGTHLNVAMLKTAGMAGMIYIIVRMGAKLLSSYITGKFFAYPPKIANHLGIALIPQAGLAIGLVISLSENDVFFSSGITPLLATIILASVAVNELIGPAAAAYSLDNVMESGQANPRLLDFLHEEYILIPLKAEDKWDSIKELSSFLIKTNNLKNVSYDDFLHSVMEREASFSTGIGNKIAVPHAMLPKGGQPVGVIGIAKKGIDFKAVDGQPVDIIILFATPTGQEAQHLRILSIVSKIFGNNKELHDRIVEATSAAEVYDILQAEEIREINYFLDENI